MHLLLTDVLTCPRCGPKFGLILLAHDMRDRRVLHGWLGCANCRNKWLVQDGFGEFRAPVGSDVENAEDARIVEADSEAAVRIAALLGVTEGPAFVLLAGPAARHAAAVAHLVEELEVIAADPALATVEETPGVSRIASGERLPFYSAKLRGVWLDGAAADTLLEEGARVLWPLGRLVLDPAPQDAEERLAAAGMRVLARKDTTLLAAREP
jgi:uncharacterized protein YbaR (Trm112 family)